MFSERCLDSLLFRLEFTMGHGPPASDPNNLEFQEIWQDKSTTAQGNVLSSVGE